MNQIVSKSPEPVFDKIYIFFLKSDLMNFEILKYSAHVRRAERMNCSERRRETKN